MKDYFKIFKDDEEFMKLHGELLKRINSLAKIKLTQAENFQYSNYGTSLIEVFKSASLTLNESNDFETFITRLLFFNMKLDEEFRFHTPFEEFFNTSTPLKNVIKSTFMLTDEDFDKDLRIIEKVFVKNFKSEVILTNDFLNEYYDMLAQDSLMVAAFTLVNYNDDDSLNDFDLNFNGVKKIYDFIGRRHFEEFYMDELDCLFKQNINTSVIYSKLLLNHLTSGFDFRRYNLLSNFATDTYIVGSLLRVLSIEDFISFVSFFINGISEDYNGSLVALLTLSSFDFNGFLEEYDYDMPLLWNLELHLN